MNDDFELAAMTIAEKIDQLHAVMITAADVGFAKAAEIFGPATTSDSSDMESLADAIAEQLQPALAELHAKARHFAEEAWVRAATISQALRSLARVGPSREAPAQAPPAADSEPNSTVSTQAPRRAA